MVYIPEQFRMDPIISTIAENKRLLRYKVIEKSGKWISEGMQSEMDTWEHFPSGIVDDLPPVLITAGTGAGKTTFVTKELAKRAAKLKRRVLLLSNRWALNFQQKINKSRENEIGVGSAMVNELKGIDNLLCYTYHDAYRSLQSIMQGSWIEFVVFDEVHFFTADSTFNAETSSMLRMFMRAFGKSRRIYMTATPEEIKPIIALEEYQLNIERAALLPVEPVLSSIIEYKFPVDYKSRVKLHFFDGAYDKKASDSVWPDIVEAIKNDKSNQKWLIFVNDKSFGAKLQKALRGVSVKRISASYHENNRTEIMDMAREAMFKEKVLIATSFLYNGISFHDPLLKNIVTDYTDQESVTQALGRKRIDSGEEVNLYIKLQSENDLRFYRDETNALFCLTQGFLNSQSHSDFLYQKWGEFSLRQQQLFSPAYWNSDALINDIQYRLAQIQQQIENCSLDRRIFPEEQAALENLLKAYTAVQAKYCNIFNGEMFRNIRLIMSDYAPYHLGKLAGSYEQIVDRFVQGEGNAFQEEVCRWFGFDYEDSMEFAKSKRQERQRVYFDEVKPKVIDCIEKYRQISPLDVGTLQKFEEELQGIIGDSGIVSFRFEGDENGDNKRTKSNVESVLKKFYPSLTCTKRKNQVYIVESGANKQ